MYIWGSNETVNIARFNHQAEDTNNLSVDIFSFQSLRVIDYLLGSKIVSAFSTKDTSENQLKI